MRPRLLTSAPNPTWILAGFVATACAPHKSTSTGQATTVDSGQPSGTDTASDHTTAAAGAYVTADRLTFPEASGPCMDAELADLDGDGDLDVVLAMEFADNIILDNDGSARFSVTVLDGPAPVAGAAGADSEDVVVLDVDGDGRLDLLFASEDGGGAEELWRNTDSGWALSSDRLPTSRATNGAALGDLNGDGVPEVVLANAGDEMVWTLDGAGGMVDVSSTYFAEPTGTVSQDPELADLDGDGDLDLVVANENGDTALFFNEGGQFVPGPFPTDPGEESREVDAGDLDGDGDLDLVVANVGWGRGPSQDRWFENDGTGDFTPRNLPVDSYETLDVDLIDLDHDGDLDILRANVDVVSGRLVAAPFDAFLNDGTGTFRPAPESLLPWIDGEGLDVEAGDLNGDGWPDLYLCASSSRDAVLLYVPGSE